MINGKCSVPPWHVLWFSSQSRHRESKSNGNYPVLPLKLRPDSVISGARKEGIEHDIRPTFQITAVNLFRDHLGRMRMQIIGAILAQYQRVAPRAQIRLQIF